MSSEDDNIRTDEYWMGVRDALRMVDSFNKWSKRNPGRAKDLENFIHDGLIAAAKRCESCLRDKLGLSFIEGEEEETIDIDLEPEESIEAPTFEMPIEHVKIEPETSPTEASDESSVSMDTVERIEDESMDDLSIEGPPREFSTDFELVEPTPMSVDEMESDAPISIVRDYPTAETEPEPELEPEPEPEPEPEEEEIDDKPSFTWSEYEAAVTPSSEPEPLDPEVDIVITEDEETLVEEEVETPPEDPPHPPEPPKDWSPYDEPSIPEDEESEDETKVDDDEIDSPEAGEDEPVISEPPPPPPPPESEDDEEERKRRARRLFFGA